MPELVRSKAEPLPAGLGKGGHFVPLPQGTEDGRMRAHTQQTIRIDRLKLYTLWRDVRNAPLFQEYVVSAEPKSPTLSTWTFGDPGDSDGARTSYDTEVYEDVPGEKISWRSIDSKFAEDCTVTFEEASGNRGTLVTLRENIDVPGGRIAVAAAALTKRTPQQIVIEDLRHFKEWTEAGEIPSVVGNSHGPRGFSGSLKARLYGENNPTPPGSSLEGKAEAPTAS